VPGFPGFPGFPGPPYQVPLSSQVTDRPRGLHSASKNPRLLQAQGSGVALHPRHAEPIFLFSSSLLGPPALGTLTTRHDTMSQTLSERCCVPAPPEGHTSPPPRSQSTVDTATHAGCVGQCIRRYARPARGAAKVLPLPHLDCDSVKRCARGQ
jgi:hypothetical protein